MITATGVTKRFGRLDVLRGINLEIAPGRVTALVGPNASGKTTFTRIVLGLVRRDAGEVLFDGRSIDGDAAYRGRIGYMPQVARYPDNLTGHDVVALLSDLRGRRAPRDEELFETLRLGAEMAKPLRHLSGGTRQRVNAALAFLFRPELLILDEPTAGLDPVSSGVLKDRIRAERAAGRTVVVTSHVLSELDEIADRVAFVLDGTIRFHGERDELMRRTGQPTLERAIAQLMRRSALSLAPAAACGSAP
jgi:Cu-processing system ATP-binding protein